MSEIKKPKNHDLSVETTFRVGCFSDNVLIPVDMEEFCAILLSAKSPVILGAGSNTLISSVLVDFPIILTKKLNKFSFEGNILTAQCGVKTAAISKKAADLGLSGLEFLSCIPASIGGTVLMNASAHKQAISDVLKSVKVFDLESKKVFILTKDKLELGYRSSILQKKPYVIMDAAFELQKMDVELIMARMDENKAYRNLHHPSMKTPNAGSVFRNPKGESAGRLIEAAGLKGKTVGGAKVSDIHANFIVNIGNATSGDILDLMSLIQGEVLQKFGFKLIPEVKYVGNDKKEVELWQKLNN